MIKKKIILIVDKKILSNVLNMIKKKKQKKKLKQDEFEIQIQDFKRLVSQVYLTERMTTVTDLISNR